MSNLFERISQVVKSEWTHRTDGGDEGATSREVTDATMSSSSSSSSSLNTRPDVKSAWRILEVAPGSTLDEVRASYRRLSTRYHPKSKVGKSDQASAAIHLLEALTEALEVLEVHLLPLPSSTSSDVRSGVR